MENNKDLSTENHGLHSSCKESHRNNEENLIENHLNEFDSPIVNKNLFKKVLPQIIVSCIVHCIVIQVGINMAYSTILDDGLRKNFSLTVNQISWIASLVTISVPLGSLIVGPLMDTFGRKKICLFCSITNIISSIILVLANSILIIYLARVTAGFSGGISTVAVIYISEITHPQIRPMLLCFNSVFVSLGILITYCLGLWFSWKQMAIIFIILNSCIFFVLLLIPESPHWLIYFGNNELNERKHQVTDVLKFFNKSEDIYQEELQRFLKILENSTINESKNSIIKKPSYFYKQLTLPNVYKPFIILFILFLLQQLSGSYVVIFYALSVFENIGGQFGYGLDKYEAMVILGVIRFLLSILTTLFSKRFGRRTLCITSSLGMAFSMFFSAIYIYFSSMSVEHDKLNLIMVKQNWVLLVAIFLYVSTSCLGVTIIPWTLVGELLPTSIRGIIGGIMISIAYIIMFGMIKCYPFIVYQLGAQGTFFFFSVTSFINAIFVYIFLPETLGKSFLEIENYFSTNKRDPICSETVTG